MDKRDVVVYVLVAGLIAASAVIVVLAAGLIFNFNVALNVNSVQDVEIVVEGTTFKPGDNLPLQLGSVNVGDTIYDVTVKNKGTVDMKITNYAVNNLPTGYDLVLSIVDETFEANTETSGQFVLTVPQGATAGQKNFTVSITLDQ